MTRIEWAYVIVVGSWIAAWALLIAWGIASVVWAALRGASNVLRAL